MVFLQNLPKGGGILTCHKFGVPDEIKKRKKNEHLKNEIITKNNEKRRKHIIAVWNPKDECRLTTNSFQEQKGQYLC